MKKYLIMIPLLWTLAYLVFCEKVADTASKAQTEILYQAVAEDVNYMESVNLTQDERKMLVQTVDERPKIFAALYDRDLNVLTKRTVTLSNGLDPFQDGMEFLKEDNGRYVIMHKHDGVVSKYNMYFNHLDNTDGELAIVGVGDGSTIFRIPGWVVAGFVIQLLVTLALQIWMITIVLKTDKKKTEWAKSLL